MNIEKLKSQYFDGIYTTKALLIKEQPFTLQSGKKSHIYLNHRNFLSNYQYLSLVVNIYHMLMQPLEKNYVLGVVDSIMSPIIVGAMSSLFNKNYVVVKKESLKHGTQEALYGEATHNTILVDDMTSTGETLIDAAQKIRHHGGNVNHVIISAYREETAIRNLQAHGIQLLAIASFDEIINYLKPMLTLKEKNIIQENPLIIS